MSGEVSFKYFESTRFAENFDFLAERSWMIIRTVYYIHSPRRTRNFFCCFICVAGRFGVGRPTVHGGPVRLRTVMSR